MSMFCSAWRTTAQTYDITEYPYGKIVATPGFASLTNTPTDKPDAFHTPALVIGSRLVLTSCLLYLQRS
ncbi:hypothetical protein NQ318_007144 [Aromia moschata]|uniref:Uncharacterized protein n=1 Tax=Aromia moschata TaxID=1265417 RepID=A0AAV8XPS2_9CUCU|nr:hypothetical protein NQ318_007144 [Aromia moschata]